MQKSTLLVAGNYPCHQSSAAALFKSTVKTRKFEFRFSKYLLIINLGHNVFR